MRLAARTGPVMAPELGSSLSNLQKPEPLQAASWVQGGSRRRRKAVRRSWGTTEPAMGFLRVPGMQVLHDFRRPGQAPFGRAFGKFLGSPFEMIAVMVGLQ